MGDFNFNQSTDSFFRSALRLSSGFDLRLKVVIPYNVEMMASAIKPKASAIVSFLVGNKQKAL